MNNKAHLLSRNIKSEISSLISSLANSINSKLQCIDSNNSFFTDSFAFFAHLIQLYEDFDSAVKSGENVDVILDKINLIRENEDFDTILKELPRALAQSRGEVTAIHNVLFEVKEFTNFNDDELYTIDINYLLDFSIKCSRNYWRENITLVKDFQENLPPLSTYARNLSDIIIDTIKILSKECSRFLPYKKDLVISSFNDDKYLAILFKIPRLNNDNSIIEKLNNIRVTIDDYCDGIFSLEESSRFTSVKFKIPSNIYL